MSRDLLISQDTVLTLIYQSSFTMFKSNILIKEIKT